jgi:ribosomal protein S18 acetylase RimI-like enzyme
MDGEDVSGVAALYWNGMAFLQAPENTGALVRAAISASGRNLCGLAGPHDQVKEALDDIGIDQNSCRKFGKELLYSLDLDSMAVPDLLVNNSVTCRHPLPGELPALYRWRMDYCGECLNQAPGESLERETRQIIDRLMDDNNLWVLETGGLPVATSGFNAVLPDMVQIGGVYTPPELRNRGYARSVVAGSLLEALENRVRRAILFTGEDMTAAKRCYRSLGFTPFGYYGLVIFKEPLTRRGETTSF